MRLCWRLLASHSKIYYLLALLPVLSSCERLEQPPYETELRSLFADMKTKFVAVEEQMRADGTVSLTSSHIDGTELKRHPPLQSRLTESQRSKYRAILGDRDAFQFIAEPSLFTVSVYVPPAHGNSYVFWFVRTNEPEELVHCSSEAIAVVCGGCSLAINNQWHMSWSWFPTQSELSDESCSFLRDDS